MDSDWEKPSFVEIAMNAEIGSYQAEFPEDPDPLHAHDEAELSEA